MIKYVYFKMTFAINFGPLDQFHVIFFIIRKSLFRMFGMCISFYLRTWLSFYMIM